jgi:hypothetical protein
LNKKKIVFIQTNKNFIPIQIIDVIFVDIDSRKKKENFIKKNFLKFTNRICSKRKLLIKFSSYKEDIAVPPSFASKFD